MLALPCLLPPPALPSAPLSPLATPISPWNRKRQHKKKANTPTRPACRPFEPSIMATNGEVGGFQVKAGLAQMLKGGVIMDVVNAEQAKIAEEAG